jgi:phosphoribosylanthranilate isomerase
MGVKDAAMLEKVTSFPGELILLDAYAPVEYGGTGETMDWSLGRQAVERWPERRVILAGGLNPDNVGAAVEQVRPYAVDVASGVELSPGRKDLAKVADFLAAAREIG